MARPGLVLVDTSAWIGFWARAGYAPLKARLDALLDEDRVATAGPIVLELLHGSRTLEEKSRLARNLRALHWLPVEDRHWSLAGEMAFGLRRAGLTVSAVDALVATLAQSYDAMLLQRDQDYELIARHSGLRLLTLP